MGGGPGGRKRPWTYPVRARRSGAPTRPTPRVTVDDQPACRTAPPGADDLSDRRGLVLGRDDDSYLRGRRTGHGSDIQSITEGLTFGGVEDSSGCSRSVFCGGRR